MPSAADIMQHRTDAFDTLYIGCETVCANEGRAELVPAMPSAANIMQHRTDGTDAIDTLYIGAEKFPYRESYAFPTTGIL